MQVVEYWDTLGYRDGTPEYNQDAHRQRTIDWLNSARGTATAFDVTTKGGPCALHAWPCAAQQLRAPSAYQPAGRAARVNRPPSLSASAFSILRR